MFAPEILDYLHDRYRPLGVIVYGSFADGSHNDHSDFDALVITPAGEKAHDGAVVHGTQLDAFVYPASHFQGDVDWRDYDQVYDGVVVRDTDGVAAAILHQVRACLDAIPPKTAAENRANVEWCEKMLLRADRGDDEGFFRRHWLLTDSLEIYFDVAGLRYRGPKKALRALAEEDPTAAALYSRALRSPRRDDLAAWIAHVRGVFEKKA